jgi:hypothetical protein
MSGRRRLALIGAAMLALEVVQLIRIEGWDRQVLVAALLLQGALYALAVREAIRGTSALAVVLAVAALLRVGPLLTEPIWTDDIYRYVWDGEVQDAGINPYRWMPADPALAFLRDDADVYPWINRKDSARTIYPPAAQMVFASVAFVQPSVLAMKLAFAAAEALGTWGMIRLLRRSGRPASQVLLYAWHPLPVVEIAWGGHVDALMVGLIPLVLLAALGGRRVLTGAALAAATLTKFFPIVLAPAIWARRDWRMPAAFAATAAALYVPYLSVGWGVFGYLGGYASEENLANVGAPDVNRGFWPVDALHAWLGVELPPLAYPALAACVLAGLALAAARRPPDDASALRWCRMLALATLLATTPHYAWYFVWPLVPLTLSPWWPGFWPSLAAPLLYWDPLNGRVPVWVGSVIYGGFALLALADLLHRRLRHDATGASHGRLATR